MSLTLTKTWGRTPRPWGYEVRADFVDEAGRIYCEELVFPDGEPTQDQLDAAVEERKTRIQWAIDQESATPPAQYLITNDDGTTTYV